MPAHHKRSETGVAAANPHAGPRIGDASFRAYFQTPEQFQSAMALASRLEAKGLRRRAWRVRLNLDGPQPVYCAPKDDEEDDAEDETDTAQRPVRTMSLDLLLEAQAEIKKLIKKTQLSHRKLSAELGVSQQTVSSWNKGGYIGKDSFEKLKKFVESMKK